MLPNSDMFPALSLQFVNGFKMGIADDTINHIKIDLVIEKLGQAADDSVLNIVEKNLLQEHLDIVFSFCGNAVLEKLTKRFTAFKKPLVHLDLGGNLVRKSQGSPFVLHHHLGICFSAYSAGYRAARKWGGNALVATSFYDGGYDIHKSFEKGFKDGGGSDVWYYVSPNDYKNHSLDPLFELIDNNKPSVLFALYSYKEGHRFLSEFNDSKINGSLPIVTTPFITNQNYMHDDINEEVSSIASWSFNDRTSEMTKWKKAYSDHYNDEPSPFSLLGFESAQILKKSIGSNGTPVSEIGSHFITEAINSPRGKLRYNCYHEVFSSQPEWNKIRIDEAENHEAVPSDLMTMDTEKLNEYFENQPISGWNNPYICT